MPYVLCDAQYADLNENTVEQPHKSTRDLGEQMPLVT
ncbi:MAG: hypothetical protein ACI84B_000403 [Oceanospirillaceae bacterium]|jgi:hypothetical protein